MAVLAERSDKIVSQPKAVAVLQIIIGKLLAIETAEPVRGGKPHIALLVLYGRVDCLLG